MSTTMNGCLEKNLVRIQGAALILDVLAANAEYAASGSFECVKVFL